MNTALLKNLWQRLLLLVLLCGVGHGTCSAETELSNVAPDSAGMFISDLCVSVATNSTEARNNLLDKGYTLLDYNLNHGVKGYYVYLGYKRSDNPLKAISRIVVKSGSEWAANKNITYSEQSINERIGGWLSTVTTFGIPFTMTAVPYIGLCNGNLDAGVEGGKELYMYYSRDHITGENNSVITRLMHGNMDSSGTLSTGFRFVSENIFNKAEYYTVAYHAAHLNTTGAERIQLICQMHEHTSDYYVTKNDNGYYRGHDCCGVHYTDPLNGGVLEISSADELYEFADLVNKEGMANLKAKLTADIVLNEGVTVMDNKDILTIQLNPDTAKVKTFRNWKPIGHQDCDFCGEFDGNGHTISGLYCVNDTAAGLFGRVSSPAVIKNVILKDSYIESGSKCGGICGSVFSTWGLITINNCTFDGIFASNYIGGGIVGELYTTNNMNIENCATRGRGVIKQDVSALGGIIGYLYSPGVINVKNCYSCIGVVKGTDSEFKEGGLVGKTSNQQSTIDNCYYLGNQNAIGQLLKELNVANCKSLSKEDFKSGKVAFLLNKFQDKPQWSQIIYTDPYPVFFDDDKHTAEAATVYMVEGYACTDKNISADTFLYSNRNDEPAILVHNGKRHHEAKQATCVEIGCLEYWECFDCSTLFSNAECTTIIINEPTLTATAQHDYDVYTETCVNCGKSRHQIEEEASAIEAVETDGIKSQMFDLLGRQVTESHRGITLIKGADGKVHKVLKK